MKKENTQSLQIEARSSQHKIQWLNLPGYKGETWNPILGCQKVSEGCRNCYAEKMAARVFYCTLNKQNETHLNYCEILTNDMKWNGESVFCENKITEPLKWKQPRVIFVCSMGDLFFKRHSFQDIDRVFTQIACNPQHIFIVLTKRAKRMAEYYNWKDTSWKNEGMQGNERIRYYAWHNHGVKIEHENWKWPLPNVWVGVSAENQEQLSRAVYLNTIEAEVKFISHEPLLSAIEYNNSPLGDSLKWHAGGLNNCVNWVIAGGESGHKARPVHPDWVRSLRDQCKSAGVPFFFKQWGEWLPWEHDVQAPFMSSQNGQFVDGHTLDIINPETGDTAKGWDDGLWAIEENEIPCAFQKVGRKAAGNLLDGKKYEEYPKINL